MSQPEYAPASPTDAQTSSAHAPDHTPDHTPTGSVTDTDAGAPGLPVRMRTVVVGVVLLAVAVLTNLRVTTSVDFQLGTVLLALMIGCGILLIAGASRRE